MRHALRVPRGLIAFVVLAALAAACRSREPAEPSNPPPAPAAPPKPTYEGIDVAGGGSISGQVFFTGTRPQLAPRPVTKDYATCGHRPKPPEELLIGPGGALRNVVVTIEAIRQGKRIAPPSTPPTLDQLKCDYIPHVQALATGTTLDILNSDDILHNVHRYLDGRESLFNLAMPLKGQKNSKQLARPGVVQLQCDAGHTWMRAYIVVVENPYFAVSDASGRFALTDVPAGSHKLKTWHEKLGILEQEVTVPAGAETPIRFEYK